MDYKKLSGVVVNAISQAMGAAYMTANPDIETGLQSSKITEIGRDLDEMHGFETFYNSIASQLARAEVVARAYSGDLASIMVKDDEYGYFMARYGFKLADIIDDPKWNLAENARAVDPVTDYSGLEHKYFDTKISGKCWVEGKGIMVPLTTPTDQIKEAFRSWDDMAAFISGVRATVANTVNFAITNYKHMLAQIGVGLTCGTALNSGNGTAIYLLDETDAAGITTADDTPESAINNAAVLEYALERMAETRDNMRVFSNAFSSGAIDTFTPESDGKLIILNKFEKSAKFKVKANTFNPSEIGIGDYETVTAWQGVAGGSRNPFNFRDVSTVAIAQDTTDIGNKYGLNLASGAFKKSYVVGLLFDRLALGVYPFKRKTTHSYTASGDFVNEFYHLLVNLIVDPRFNMVSFILDRKPTT